ncbi:IucA/IucC family protein [Kribbella sp. CA-293567]|uniref:IucA/IucC family protein n=1 Tax=Kribbella sp. CA-293567 TaxID=3002436 RepID=UPI0022DE8249|nr:IucA/IucC family protein [Kribbella sp. CA-293567]WBQ08196.1 hypothetical protein OX958_15640 [Kribbella sp. CA-293567]
MSAEDQLTLRVLSALLRENVLGVRTVEERADGLWLSGDHLALPVIEEGFQSEYAARLPLLEVDGQPVAGLDHLIAVLRERADPEDQGGYDAFAEECRQTLATMELHAEVQPGVLAALGARYGSDPAGWIGLGSSLAQDTLAAFLDHPVYPAARGRSGLTDDQLARYAPEFHPSFKLRWIAVPSGTLRFEGGQLPQWWPTPAQIGLPELEGCSTLPIHPLTFDTAPTEILGGVRGPAPYLDVVPTLSMRSVAVVQDPRHHLKLPLPTATLGVRNRRTIKAGVLADGAAGERLMRSVIAREPRFATTILNADEQTFAESGHELLAVLLRRYPAGLDDAVTVPLAALTATAPNGRLVIEQLADSFYGGEVLALYDAFVLLLFDWQITLFRYGIALESHQQNTSLVLDRVDGVTRIRLLYKDNDGLRINPARLPANLPAEEFDDARIFTDGDRGLTDLFTTITVHLCAASVAFALADRLPLQRSLGVLRRRLTEAIDALGAEGAVLRADLLDADRLPVKAMVTAGTLLSKARSGAADINKHYTSGPNYLRGPASPR